MGKDEKDSLRRDAQQVLSKKKLRELVEQIDPAEKLDPDVEAVRITHRMNAHPQALLDLADDFIHSVTRSACQLARHRGSDTLEVKDMLLHLETAYNIRVPGFSDVDVKPVRKGSASAAHQQRISHVRRAQAADAAEKDREKARLRERTGGAKGGK